MLLFKKNWTSNFTFQDQHKWFIARLSEYISKKDVYIGAFFLVAILNSKKYIDLLFVWEFF